MSENGIPPELLKPGGAIMQKLPLLIVKPGVGSLWHAPDCTTPRPESPCRCGKVNLEWT